MAWTTPPTFTAGQTLSAADMTIISNNLTALPRGYITSAAVTSNQGSITTITDVTGLSVSVPRESGRKYLTTVHLDVYSSVSGDVIVVYITDASDNQLARATTRVTAATVSETLEISLYEAAGSSSTVTRKVRCERASGTGNVTVIAASTYPAQILALDLGTG